MIAKKDFESKTTIQNDKEDFMVYAEERGFDFNDILDYMEYYENLNSFDDNILSLSEFIDDRRIN